MSHENDAKTSGHNDSVPRVTLDQVPDLVWRLYGLQTEDVETLPSHEDVNWFFRADQRVDNDHISSVCTDGYVLKILNTRTQDTRCIEAMHIMMKRARHVGVGTQEIVLNKSGKEFSVETLTDHNNGTTGPYIVRLRTFVPGPVLLNTPHVAGTFRNIGEMVGKLHKAVKRDVTAAGSQAAVTSFWNDTDVFDTLFQDFHHPYYDTFSTIWDLAQFLAVRDFLHAVHDDTNRRVVEEVLDAFENDVKPEFEKFRKSIIHGDINTQNLVMRKVPLAAGEIDTGVHDVKALIDFDDACQSYAVMEVATVMAYISIECPFETQLDAGGHFLSGYYKHCSLNEAEKRCLRTLVCARLGQSLTFCAHEYSLQPGNEYLLTTAKRGWPLLHRLWGTDETELYPRWDEIVRANNHI